MLTNKHSRRASARLFRPQVEALEQRLTPSFTPVGPFTVGSNPTALAVGDFNGDGKPDLAVANHLSTTASILLGIGAGGFADAPDLSIPPGATSVAVGDFNNDGHQDLAIAIKDDSSTINDMVSLWRGDGAGRFTHTGNIAAGEAPLAVAVADFNRDGKHDLAIAKFSSNAVSIRLGDGAGGFTAQPDFPVGTGPNFVALADFNGDSNQDLAVVNFGGGTVSICLGNGAGGFTVQPALDVGKDVGRLAVGDFNGDGRQDLAVPKFDADAVRIFQGNGAGAFAPLGSDVAVGNGPIAAAVADFNLDGHLDFAVTNFENPSGAGFEPQSIRLNNGAGGFVPSPGLPAGLRPYAVAVGDFNGDGKPDLAVTDSALGKVSVLLNTFPFPQITARAFQKGGVTRLRVRDAATGAVRAVLTPFKGFGGQLLLRRLDVNGDGSLDLIVKAVIGGKLRRKIFDARTLARLA